MQAPSLASARAYGTEGVAAPRDPSPARQGWSWWVSVLGVPPARGSGGGPGALTTDSNAGTAVALARGAVAVGSLPIGSIPAVRIAVPLEPSSSTPPVTHKRHHQHHDDGHPDPHPEGHVYASGPRGRSGRRASPEPPYEATARRRLS